MKKTLPILLSLVIIVIVLLATEYCISQMPQDLGTFSLSEYQECIDNSIFQTNLNYGKIQNQNDAVKAAQKAFENRFDPPPKSTYFNRMIWEVKFDPQNNAWHVRTLPKSNLVMGGGFEVILTSDGDILSIWGWK